MTASICVISYYKEHCLQLIGGSKNHIYVLYKSVAALLVSRASCIKQFFKVQTKQLKTNMDFNFGNCEVSQGAKTQVSGAIKGLEAQL